MQLWCCEDRRKPFVEVFRRSATAAGYDLRLITPGAAPPPDFATVVEHYRHLSPNPRGFELAAIRRYFEIRDQVDAGAGRFIVADSDLLVLAGPAALPAELMQTGALVGSIGTTGGVAETDVSAHFSIWTPEQLQAFCAFVVRVYTSAPDRLAAIHAARVAAGNPRAAISDMTLVYLWMQDEGVPFVNSNRLFGDRYVDHNISMSDCANARFRQTLGRKTLTFDRDSVSLTTTTGARIAPAVLHFVGRNKIYAPAVEAGRSVEIAARSLYIVVGRRVRRWLAA